MKVKDLNSLLYNKVLDKVKEFYFNQLDQNLDFSGNFEEDRIKDSFGRILKGYFEEETKIKNPLNHRTILNIINTGLAVNVRPTTLDILSKFVGYEDYNSFKKEVNKESSRKKTWIYYAIPVLLLAGFVFYNFNQSHDKELFELIELANETQFKTYQALPEIDLKDLQKYYTKDGSAYLVIENILKRSAQLNRVIKLPADNPSYYNIHQLQIISKKPKRVLIESTEHWYLRWYSLSSQQYIKKYDVSNTQIYSIVKENGIWKIEDNDYMGTAEDIKPSLD